MCIDGMPASYPAVLALALVGAARAATAAPTCTAGTQLDAEQALLARYLCESPHPPAALVG